MPSDPTTEFRIILGMIVTIALALLVGIVWSLVSFFRRNDP